MPNTCAAYGCNYKFGPDTKQKGITFHLLPPPTDVRRKLWISNSRRIDPVTRKPWDPTSKYVYFCSEHFMPSDFENTGKPFGRRLKDDAVPTVFTFPTHPPDSPVKQNTVTTPSDIQDPVNVEKNKLLARARKSKHRKVVMLPKKIKQLQENSPSNVESVTIISFQHLDYDEKFQPMFEEAMLELQCPEDSELEPEEEYFEDEYTELQDTVPLDDELVSFDLASKNDRPAHDPKEADSGVEISETPGEITEAEQQPENDTEYPKVDETDSATNMSANADADIQNVTELGPNTPSDVNTQTNFEEELPRNVEKAAKNGLQPERMRALQKEERTAVKRRIPVVIKELSVIDDIEDLRIKAFRIAEDNIKLKKQVIYLEQKLEEVVSQVNVK